MKQFWRMGLALVLIALVLPSHHVSSQPPGVSDKRFARLARGANLSQWFWGGSVQRVVTTAFSPRDFETLHRLGFTCVRLPIDLNILFDPNSDDLLNDEGLAALDAALDLILGADLAVIVDIHSTWLTTADIGIYSAALEKDDGFIETFITFWKSLAAHLSTRDPEMVFFEPMNEPVFLLRPATWVTMQEDILAAIREAAPENTLIATSAWWSGLDTFVTLEPLGDSNIVYNFHFYEPMTFTHQGATWAGEQVKPLRSVPYPSSPEAVAPLIERTRAEGVKETLRLYGEARWDAAKIRQRIGLAGDWGQAHGVRVICNEFGVYDKFAPVEGRVQWHRDVRAAFDEYHIGWAIWDYYGQFGLARRENGGIFIDLALAEALGLAWQ